MPSKLIQQWIHGEVSVLISHTNIFHFQKRVFVSLNNSYCSTCHFPASQKCCQNKLIFHDKHLLALIAKISCLKISWKVTKLPLVHTQWQMSGKLAENHCDVPHTDKLYSPDKCLHEWDSPSCYRWVGRTTLFPDSSAGIEITLFPGDLKLILKQ